MLRRRRVATAVTGDLAVDNHHPYAGNVAEIDRFQNIVAGGMLRRIEQETDTFLFMALDKHGDERLLMVKQARPYSFGSTPIPNDCREL